MRNNPVAVAQRDNLVGVVGDIYGVGEGEFVIMPAEKRWLCDHVDRDIGIHYDCRFLDAGLGPANSTLVCIIRQCPRKGGKLRQAELFGPLPGVDTGSKYLFSTE